MTKLKEWLGTLGIVLLIIFTIAASTTFTCAYLLETYVFNQINCVEDDYSAKICIDGKVINIDHVSELYIGIKSYKITDASTGKTHIVSKNNVDLIKNPD